MLNFKESFLHFIWQYQLFDKANLQTTHLEDIQIFKQGNHNTDAGPDFLDCKITIDKVLWFGAIEIHTRTSDWLKHGHQFDKAYEQVVLHVVWENDEPLLRNDGTVMPTLILSERINQRYISRYQALLEEKQAIACAPLFNSVSDVVVLGMFDRALFNRQEHKTTEITSILASLNYSWEETCYRMLAKNFGFKINAFPFQKLAERLPLKLLLKHHNNLLQIEALLFGTAGFLSTVEAEDAYGKSLQKEYQFLAHKYGIANQALALHEWKYLRLRPANFPTIRIAQFAMLIHQQANLFTMLTTFDDCTALVSQLRVSQSDYWKHHYHFKLPSNKTIGRLGKTSVDNVIINTVVPLLFALSKLKNELSFSEKAINLLEQLPSEQNVLTLHWATLGVTFKNAFQSQAAIELQTQYCAKKRCLACAIGISIMKK
jgi:hypothetical protein